MNLTNILINLFSNKTIEQSDMDEITIRQMEEDYPEDEFPTLALEDDEFNVWCD